VSNPLATGLAVRSRQLADQLVELRSRVREAVAAELGRVVADAVRDLLTAFLRGRPPDRPDVPDRRSGRSRADPWDDDPDDWRRGDDDGYGRNDDELDGRSRRPMTGGHDPPPPTSWASALSAGITATRWLLAQGLRAWPCVGAGIVVGAASLAGGPAVRTVLAAAVTALELVCLTLPGPD
jgi:hypothetical protein